MKIREIMTNLTNLTKVIRKDVDMPFELRRAMRRNYKVLSEEYGLYEEERIKLKKKLEEGTEEKVCCAHETRRSRSVCHLAWHPCIDANDTSCHRRTKETKITSSASNLFLLLVKAEAKAEAG